MANGNGGFTIAGGVHVSTGAIIMGGIAAITAIWLLGRKIAEEQMSDLPQEIRILNDVYRAAAYPAQVSQNHDRIMAAIQRIRDQFRVAREAFQKKIRDLVEARRKGTITNDQFRAQFRLAINEFHVAIRLRHKEIMQQLGVPVRNKRIANGPPTTP